MQTQDLQAHRIDRAAMLEAVKARPADVGLWIETGATADLDSPCARQRSDYAAGMKGSRPAEAEPKEDPMMKEAPIDA